MLGSDLLKPRNFFKFRHQLFVIIHACLLVVYGDKDYLKLYYFSQIFGSVLIPVCNKKLVIHNWIYKYDRMRDTGVTMASKIQSVKGTREFYPEQMSLRNFIYEKVRAASQLVWLSGMGCDHLLNRLIFTRPSPVKNL